MRGSGAALQFSSPGDALYFVDFLHASNKRAVKTVRVYLDYLYKAGRVSREERDRWKEV